MGLRVAFMASSSGGNGLVLARGLARLADDRDSARPLLVDKDRELHAREKSDNGGVELFPQVVRHAALVLAAVLAAAGLRRVAGRFDGKDDVGDRNLARIARQVIAAPRTAHAFDERAAAELAEQLL